MGELSFDDQVDGEIVGMSSRFYLNDYGFSIEVSVLSSSGCTMLWRADMNREQAEHFYRSASKTYLEMMRRGSR